MSRTSLLRAIVLALVVLVVGIAPGAATPGASTAPGLTAAPGLPLASGLGQVCAPTWGSVIPLPPPCIDTP